MSIKKELIFGIITIILVVFVIFLLTNRFNNQKKVNQNSLDTTSRNQIDLTKTELSKHNTHKDCWLLINNKLYDVTDYLFDHPGGADLIIPFCGKESTQAFETKGGKGPHTAKAVIDLKKYYIGDLNEK